MRSRVGVKRFATAVLIPAVRSGLNIPDMEMQCQTDSRTVFHFFPIYGTFNNSFSLEVATLSTPMLNRSTRLIDTEKRKWIYMEILDY
ncbi:hypothetical protein C0Z18_20670 [Trinickia dabaoshanensis]|uniref:Uncharacterized protein n=1 Tax=Trinickia dabaoshanensis TaxID=564714 RepID=A0A2N7VJ51_9BURK|nr:hypothetical protein C0Z18_20670 [Trinickia dabaoshanensis]